MFKLFRKSWKYFVASLTGKFNEYADPKIQLEQALAEAQQNHRQLTQQAASVIANQKLTEARLGRAIDGLAKTQASARQALLMADDATKNGKLDDAAAYNKSAEAFANRLVTAEAEVESLKTMALQTAEASVQAKAAVQQNSSALQKKLSDKQKLMSQLDQAKMQEQMNKAMGALSASVGAEVPTLDEVRDKIEARYAKAIGAAELQAESVDSHMLEIEQAQVNVEATARLNTLREQLGLPVASATEVLGEALVEQTQEQTAQ